MKSAAVTNNTISALDSLKGEHYIRGRRAALAGNTLPSSSAGQPGTLENEQFRLGAKTVSTTCAACHCGGRGLCADIA